MFGQLILLFYLPMNIDGGWNWLNASWKVFLLGLSNNWTKKLLCFEQLQRWRQYLLILFCTCNESVHPNFMCTYHAQTLESFQMQRVLFQGVPSSENRDVLRWHPGGASHPFCLCPFLGESVAALQGDEKTTITKVGDVFPILVDPLQAMGAVGAETWHCLEEEAGCSQNQLCPLSLPWCVPEMGLLLWPCADLSPPDTPPRIALKKEIPLLTCHTYHTKPGERRLVE